MIAYINLMELLDDCTTNRLNHNCFYFNFDSCLFEIQDNTYAFLKYLFAIL